jgi:Phage integrase, N-terminal SAM-like domain
MDPLGPDPLIRSFERHLYAGNRSARTVTTYLIAVRQADSFLRERGTRLEAATRADLEAFLGDLLSRRKASTAATYHKVLKILYGWLAEEAGWASSIGCYGVYREDSSGRAKMIRISQPLVALHEEHHGHDCRGWPAGRPGAAQPR